MERLPARDAKIAHDVGRHAADEMLATCMRICETAGEGISIAATLTAFAYTLYRIKATAKAMDKVTPGFSQHLETGAALIEKETGPKFEEFAEAERKRRGL